jgi:hypothetical protein
MESNDLSWPRIKHSNTSNAAVPRPAETFETNGGPEAGIQAALQREKARLKLLLELAKQAISNQELRDVLRAVITSIRNGVLCDGVCICLIPSNGGELQVCALDFPDEADFQEGATIPSDSGSATPAMIVARTVRRNRNTTMTSSSR